MIDMEAADILRHRTTAEIPDHLCQKQNGQLLVAFISSLIFAFGSLTFQIIPLDLSQILSNRNFWKTHFDFILWPSFKLQFYYFILVWENE